MIAQVSNRLFEHRDLSPQAGGAMLLVIALLAAPWLVDELGAASTWPLAPALLAACALLLIRKRTWIEVAQRTHVSEWRIGGWQRRSTVALDRFRGVAAGPVLPGGGPPSCRILLVSPTSPASRWGTHSGHLCIEIVSGPRAQAVERARSVAQQLGLPVVDESGS